MKRTFNIETIKKIGSKVKVCGWVQAIRSHGKLVFVDLRDRSGIMQAVFSESYRDVFPSGEDIPISPQLLRPEWVVELSGTIKRRPKGMANPELATGKVELAVESFKVLSKAKTPPFDLSSDSRKINEEKRLKYRYLDLRTQRMKNNLLLRHKVVKFMRDFMDSQGFVEIETPLLTKSTPEGARDFIVPSRLHPGRFYALPQSPQQYKQLLMVAGLERYFQVVRCLRDEDPRADRQAEHTQLDIEMSFASQEDILLLVQNLYKQLVKKIVPEKRIQRIPFARLTYEQAMKRYKSDRPDLRRNKNNPDELAFCFVTDFPMFEWHQKEKRLGAMHHPFTQPQTDDIKAIKKNPKKLLAWQYDVVLNGYEIGGGSIRTTNPQVLRAVFEVLGHSRAEIDKQFGHLLTAFQYGVPPHGGIALGVDRLVMLLAGEESIREVMAFPKTGDGRSLMMGTPSPVSKEQLKELHIKTTKSKK